MLPTMLERDYMHLFFVKREIAPTGKAHYTFVLDGKSIRLDSKEARELVSSIPVEQRNCKVSFCEVKLKPTVAEHATVATVYES